MCACWYFHTMRWIGGNGRTQWTPRLFFAATDGFNSDNYKTNVVQEVWKPRVGGFWCAAKLINYVKPNGLYEFMKVFGAYEAGWLFLTFLVLIIFLKEPIFVMAMTLCGLMYSALVTCYDFNPFDVIIFPWDAPSLFFWTLTFLLWQQKHYRTMIVVLALGTIFKESVSILAVLLFFTHLPKLRRLQLFMAAVFSCMVIKSVISGHLFTAAHDHNSVWVWLWPFFAWEFCPHMNCIWWANAGLTVSVFLLPWKSREDKGIILTLLLFYLAATITPIMVSAHYETRQFVDCLTMSAIFLQSKIKLPQASYQT